MRCGASSRGLGELLSQLRAPRLVVGLGGTATMDGGVGLLEVLDALPAPTTVLCDVQTTLLRRAARSSARRRARRPSRSRSSRLASRADGARALRRAARAGRRRRARRGARVARRRARAGRAARSLDLVGFDPRGRTTLVVTGEGRVDATTAEGKAPAEVVRRCAEAGVPCVVFGGVVSEPLPGVETVALSGDPAQAADDLFELGLRLGTRLLDAAG